jgi:16S rRNA (guanine527-N7)-methyltransferase
VTDDLGRAIAAECDRLGLVIAPEAMPRLAAYAASLWSWNERLNLTRHVDAPAFVSRDVADAAAIAAHLAQGERVLDVGTGGGVPGVILAIIRPDLHVELCDSVAKKARAVGEIVREAGLTLPVHAAAAQTIVAGRPAGRGRFDTLVVRAVAPLGKLLGWFGPVIDSFGRMLLVKGPRWEEERDDARFRGQTKRVLIRRVASWPIEGRDHESVLLEVRRRDPTA